MRWHYSVCACIGQCFQILSQSQKIFSTRTCGKLLIRWLPLSLKFEILTSALISINMLIKTTWHGIAIRRLHLFSCLNKRVFAYYFESFKERIRPWFCSWMLMRLRNEKLPLTRWVLHIKKKWRPPYLNHASMILYPKHALNLINVNFWNQVGKHEQSQ